MSIIYFASETLYSNILLISFDINEKYSNLRVTFSRKYFNTANKTSKPEVESEYGLTAYIHKRDIKLVNLKHGFIIGRTRSV